MRQLSTALVLACLTLTAAGQGTNTLLSSLAIDRSASDPTILGQGPFTENVFTDSPITINVRALGNTPVIIIQGNLQVGSFTDFGMSVDILPVNSWFSNILVDGFASPGPQSVTSPSGDLSLTMTIPACTTNNFGQTFCTLPPTFGATAQAICTNPLAPVGIATSAATTASFTNGYQSFTIGTEGSAIFNFLGGFTYTFYGVTYTRAWLSENGYVSFTPASGGFPSPTVSEIRSGAPRIMSFYNDLNMGLPNSVISAQQSTQNGLRQIKFVHGNLAEFANTTGPHGGDIIIYENGDARVLVHNTNAAPSINTGVGLTPGSNIDNGNPPAPGQTAFGRDLSADFLTASASGIPVSVGALRACFELFTGQASTNNLDLAGLGFGNGGIGFYLDLSLPNLNGYAIGP